MTLLYIEWEHQLNALDLGAFKYTQFRDELFIIGWIFLCQFRYGFSEVNDTQRENNLRHSSFLLLVTYLFGY